MKRNARGGLVVEKGHIDPDTLPAEAYGPTTQCPSGKCGHVLCEEQWNPRYEPFQTALCVCGNPCGEERHDSVIFVNCTPSRCFFTPPAILPFRQKKEASA